MAIDNDEKDDESFGIVCIERARLGSLFMLTAETIGYEDHGEFVVVAVDDLQWLEGIAAEVLKEFGH